MTTRRTELFDFIPSKVLAIYAHPDDADVACAGSLAKWVAQGSDVHLVVLTDGGKGTHDAATNANTLMTTRSDEVHNAAKALGVQEVELMGIPDGEVASRQNLIEEIVARIRTIRPEIVVSHDPTAVFFGSVYVNHQDHRAGGFAVLDAVAPAAAMPLYFPSRGPAHQVRDVLLSGTLDADCFVDVTDTIDQKVMAVTAHRSQLSDDLEWVAESIRQQAIRDGKVVGVAAAEGFRHLRLDG